MTWGIFNSLNLKQTIIMFHSPTSFYFFNDEKKRKIENKNFQVNLIKSYKFK